MQLCIFALHPERRDAPTKKGPRRALLRSTELGEDQLPTATKAAATEEPRTRIRAGAIRSKNRSNLDMVITHTFELEPRGERGICYFNGAKIVHI